MSPAKRKVQEVPADVDEIIAKLRPRISQMKWSGANGMPCTGKFHNVLPDGTIEVLTHIGNTNRPLQVGRNYVFWDYVREKLLA